MTASRASHGFVVSVVELALTTLMAAPAQGQTAATLTVPVELHTF